MSKNMSERIMEWLPQWASYEEGIEGSRDALLNGGPETAVAFLHGIEQQRKHYLEVLRRDFNFDPARGCHHVEGLEPKLIDAAAREAFCRTLSLWMTLNGAIYLADLWRRKLASKPDAIRVAALVALGSLPTLRYWMSRMQDFPFEDVREVVTSALSAWTAARTSLRTNRRLRRRLNQESSGPRFKELVDALPPAVILAASEESGDGDHAALKEWVLELLVAAFSGESLRNVQDPFSAAAIRWVEKDLAGSQPEGWSAVAETAAEDLGLREGLERAQSLQENREELQALIQRADLTQREREIMELRRSQPELTNTKIAELLGISQASVAAQWRAAMRKLRQLAS